MAEVSWDAEISAAEVSGSMKESMETMKKAWKDASSTPEGKASSGPEHTMDNQLGFEFLPTFYADYGDDGSIALLSISQTLTPSDYDLI
jgi:hypothetical protein